MKLNEACAAKGVVSCINTISYKMLHVAYPQKGNNKKVQIDLLLTKYPEFTKFFMYSPSPEESKYKGAHRNELLHAIAKIISFKEVLRNDDGELVKWSQETVTEDGYYSVLKTLVDDEGNKLKYKNTNEDLEPEYALDEDKRDITHNVDDVIAALFGNGYTVSDIDTFEKCFEIIKNDQNFIHKDKSDEILHECAVSLHEKRKRLIFPQELKSYLKKN